MSRQERHYSVYYDDQPGVKPGWVLRIRGKRRSGSTRTPSRWMQMTQTIQRQHGKRPLK